MPTTLSRADARRLLVAHHALGRTIGRGARGVRAVLERLRCIQLDPLDAIGTNADLVVMARVDDVARGDVWRHLFPAHAFEHFAKERCILPARAFPYYREQGHAAQTPWWRHAEREERVAPELVAAVLEEIRERGPLTARDLTDHGSVDPIDWSGWKGTAKATSMALEILWTRCDIVVAGRTESGAKVYDVPERALRVDEPTRRPVDEPTRRRVDERDTALPDDSTTRRLEDFPRRVDEPTSRRVDERDTALLDDSTTRRLEDFPRWALRERAHAAGLLTRAGGSIWSMLSGVRTSPLVDEMIARGELLEIAIEDSTRRYLAVPQFLKAKTAYDDRVRILGPLDPLLWDRDLVRHVFDFDYVWEVYKPEPQRKWGWYVCPLLHRDRLIGRIDARIEGAALVVKKMWLESADADRAAIDAALERHAAMCGAKRVRMPRRVSSRV